MIESTSDIPTPLPETFGTGVFQHHDLTQQTNNGLGAPSTTPIVINDSPPATVVPSNNTENPNVTDGSEVQPDSEPDQASDMPNAPTDAAQIPIPDQPFSEEEQESGSDALRAESQVFDHWIVKGKKVIIGCMLNLAFTFSIQVWLMTAQ